MQLLSRCVRRTSQNWRIAKPLEELECDRSSRRIFLVRASRSKDGQTMIHFKPPQFLHWKKLLKSHQRGCHRQHHVKLIESCKVRSTALKTCWWVMGFILYEVCDADEFSCLAAPCYFASRGVTDGNGNLEALVWDQYFNRRDERLARGNSERYMQVRYPGRWSRKEKRWAVGKKTPLNRRSID